MFSKKTLRIEIQLEEGKFEEGKSKVIDFRDVPIDAVIKRVSGFGDYSARIRIYGISKEHLNMVTLLKWREISIPQRAVRIFSDNGKGEKLLYEGNIASADPIYDAPNVYIDIQSVAGIFFNAKRGIPPSHLSGEVSATDIFAKICKDYGIGFKIDAPISKIKCRDPYFGQTSLFSRVKAASNAYGVVSFIHNDYVEFLAPMDGYSYLKKWTFTPNDFIGYPRFTDGGIRITTDEMFDVGLFDVFEISDSEVTPANGNWFVTQATLNVSTRIGGKWFMTIDGAQYV